MAGWQLHRGDGALALAGELVMADAAAIWRALRDAVDRAATPEHAVQIDLSAVPHADAGIVAMIDELRRSVVARGARCEIVGATGRLAELVRLHALRPGAPRARPPRLGLVDQVGAGLLTLGRELRDQVAFVGELIAGLGRTARRPRDANWGALPALIGRVGTDGIAIVVLLNFLVGFVMAYQSSHQLKLYGANIFVADIVGISITRELGPLITAVIAAGRTGAAYAAELGTMRVSEEIDALRVMGIAPVPYLVVPRTVALAIVAPMLTVLADVAGVFGGLVVGAASLDVTPQAYLSELRDVVIPSDVWTGLIKSVAFGVAIALLGCERGLATRGAAAGVGRSTTTTVVRCLFAIVLIDTLFTVVFRRLAV